MINQPTLLIQQQIAERNIGMMIEKARMSNAILRPHFKSHQSIETGRIYREKGVNAITVSSVSMAAFFAEDGWDDITIAFPVNLLEIDQINNLAGKIKLNLIVDSTFSTQRLSELMKAKIGIFIEIDNGYHRSGLLPEQMQEIENIVEIIAESGQLKFKGFLTHAGNTYNAKGKVEILSIMEDASKKLSTLKEKYISRFPEIITSYGDTPSCSLSEDLSDFDEIRPGNFVYYDVMQYHIGSCLLDDVAVAVACPIVSVYPERNELVIYGGAVHLSKECIEADDNFKLFGYVVSLTNDGWSKAIPGAYVLSISQEHGIVKMTSERIKDFKPGDIVGVLPIHSCLTADLLKDKSTII